MKMKKIEYASDHWGMHLGFWLLGLIMGIGFCSPWDKPDCPIPDENSISSEYQIRIIHLPSINGAAYREIPEMGAHRTINW